MDSKTATAKLFRSLEEDANAPPMDLKRMTPEEARTAAPDFLAMLDMWSGKRNGAALPGETFTQAIDANVKGVHFSEGWPRLYNLQFREHFGAIRQHGLIGLSEGRIAMSARSFLSIRVLELPVRAGGDDVRRLIHVVKVIIG